MSEREILRFEHLGCTMVVVVQKVDGEWHSHFDLKCPPDAKQYTLSGREGPYGSAEEAFEKAKQWARQEIAQLCETSQSSASADSRGAVGGLVDVHFTSTTE